jgi:hypothetical protein
MIWNQVMIDVECAGTTRDAALMAVGAACFDLHRYEIGPTFVVPIHVATSVALGMRIDPSGFLFWLRQSDEARKAVAYNLVDVTEALTQFSAWMAEHTRRQDVRVWGNSSAFDMSILNFAYDRIGQPMPWGFGKETCFRTVRNMNSHVEYDPKLRASVHHNALDDSIFQIEHLFRIRRFNLEHRPLAMPK